MWIHHPGKAVNVLQYVYRDLANRFMVTSTVTQFLNLLLNMREREHFQSKPKGNLLLLICWHPTQMDEKPHEGQAFWAVEFSHIKLTHNILIFCSVSREARQWQTLVIQRTQSILSINNESVRICKMISWHFGQECHVLVLAATSSLNLSYFSCCLITSI